MKTSSTDIPIIIEDKKVHQGPNFSRDTYEILEHFAIRFNQHDKIRNIEVYFDVIKNSSDKVKFYEIKLHVQLANGKLLIGNVQTKNILAGLREAIQNIGHEAERTDRQKHDNFRKYY